MRETVAWSKNQRTNLVSYTVMNKSAKQFFSMSVLLPSRGKHFLASTNFAHAQNPASDRQKNKKNKFVSQNLSNGLSGTLEISTDNCTSGYGIYFQQTSHLNMLEIT